jgi:hypothetical protein
VGETVEDGGTWWDEDNVVEAGGVVEDEGTGKSDALRNLVDVRNGFGEAVDVPHDASSIPVKAAHAVLLLLEAKRIVQPVSELVI